jgi:hypothetical protein
MVRLLLVEQWVRRDLPDSPRRKELDAECDSHFHVRIGWCTRFSWANASAWCLLCGSATAGGIYGKGTILELKPSQSGEWIECSADLLRDA